MLELFHLAPSVKIVCTSIFLLGIIAQAARLFLLLLHREHKAPPVLLLFEILILAHLVLTVLLLTSSWLLENVIAGYFSGFRVIDVVPVLVGVWIMLTLRKPEPFFSSLLLLPTLPYWSLPNVHYYFVFGNLGLVCRGWVMLHDEWQRVMSSISRLSIKEAVDQSPEGILYANDHGRILVSNPAMDRLLYALGFDSPGLNAIDLWNNLVLLQDGSVITARVLDDKLLLRIRNAEAWLFSNQEIVVNKKKYLQLLAFDITEEDLLTREIENSNSALEAAGREIAADIDNIEQWEKEKAILCMKSRVHDIFGQRLSILSRILESEMDVDEMIRKLKPLLTNLTDLLVEAEGATLQTFLSSLIESFALIGTAIQISGTLPEKTDVAQVFAQVIQECTTNAVRHGSARNVRVELQESGAAYILSIGNDGTLPSGQIVEGEGISGMRRKIHELQGTLDFTTVTSFQVLIHVPKTGDEKDDQDSDRRRPGDDEGFSGSFN